jgi:hypothetical protein
LTSKSKIPPKLDHSALQVVEQGDELVEALGFHGVLPVRINRPL